MGKKSFKAYNKYIYVSLYIIKWSYIIQLYKNMFRLWYHTQVFDTLWAMLENDRKCIWNYVSWFFYVTLNFNVLCNANIDQRYYAELFRSNWIFCLMLGTFLKLHLTVSDEVEDHFWLYFVHFLNHNLSMKKFID